MIARSRLEPANTDQAGSGAHSVPKPRGLPVKAGESYSAPIPRKSTVSSDFAYGIGTARSACHAEGRGFESHQPLQERLAFAGLFCVGSRLVRLRRVGLTPDSPRADRRPFQEERPVCRPILVRSNRSPSAGLQKVGCSACWLQRHDPVDSARRGDTSGRGPWEQSGFSPETERSVNLARAPRPGEPWPPES